MPCRSERQRLVQGPARRDGTDGARQTEHKSPNTLTPQPTRPAALAFEFPSLAPRLSPVLATSRGSRVPVRIDGEARRLCIATAARPRGMTGGLIGADNAQLERLRLV
jgi:hypothetical protein